MVSKKLAMLNAVSFGATLSTGSILTLSLGRYFMGRGPTWRKD